MKPLKYIEKQHVTIVQEADQEADDIEVIKFEPDVFPDDFFPHLDAVRFSEADNEAPQVKAKRKHRKRKNQDPEVVMQTALQPNLDVALIDPHMEASLHTPVFKCTFPSCKKTFAADKYRRRHETRNHSEKKHACQQCDKAYCTPAQLTEHVQRVHGTQLQCPHCDYKNPKQFILNNHIRDKHSGVEFKCNICDKKYRDSKTL